MVLNAVGFSLSLIRVAVLSLLGLAQSIIITLLRARIACPDIQYGVLGWDQVLLLRILKIPFTIGLKV